MILTLVRMVRKTFFKTSAVGVMSVVAGDRNSVTLNTAKTAEDSQQ